ncbi:MAG: hypothetical protein ABR521_07615 [Gaiellaceae bacterium]
MCETDIARLRAAGLDDRAIVDANQVVAYFNTGSQSESSGSRSSR